MTNKELYREFCQTNGDLPLFMTDWWMDAVCAGKHWDVLLSLDESGKIQAVLPYLLRKRAWMRYIIMPQQTQIGGIVQIVTILKVLKFSVVFFYLFFQSFLNSFVP